MTWPITSARYQQDAPDSTDLWSDVIGQVQSLSVTSSQDPEGTPLVMNGSFEIDPPNTNQPSGWVVSGGINGSVTQSYQDHGVQSYMVTQAAGTGLGAGNLTSAGYMNVSANMAYRLQWEFMTTQTNVSHKAEVIWFDSSQAKAIQTDTVFTQQGNFTQNFWYLYSYQINPPTGAVSAKLRFTLGSPSFPPGGQANLCLDNISTVFRPPYSKVVGFNNTNSWIVPPGTFRIWVKAVGGGGKKASDSNGGAGGYCEGFFDVVPGQTINLTVGSVGNTNPPTTILGMTAQQGQDGSGSSSAGGTGLLGAVNITGGSSRMSQSDYITYQSGEEHTSGYASGDNDTFYYIPGVTPLGPAGMSNTNGMVVIYY